MRLILSIENFQRLPDGGPLVCTIQGQRGADIGREQYLDWCLPDETRFISGKHCEIRSRDGRYYLYDVSKNGTFLNDAEYRVQSPHLLRNGDRLTIGPYIIGVTVDVDGAEESPPSGVVARPRSYDETWSSEGEAAAPIRREELLPKRIDPASQIDWADHRADMPTFDSHGASAPRPSAEAARTPAASAFAAFGSAGDAWMLAADARVASTPSPSVSAADFAVADAEWSAGVPPVRVETAPEPPPPPTPRRGASVGSKINEIASVAKTAPEDSPAAAPPDSGAYAEFLGAFCARTGMPQAVLAQKLPGDFGDLLGALLLQMTEETRQLLLARGEAKRMTRSANQTMLQAVANNPLKVSPTSEEAMRLLLGPPRPSYLDAPRAFGQAFADLKMHQLRTYTAMQQAVRMLAEDLDPLEIDKSLGKDSGLAAVMGSRKARLWDIYVARWTAKNRRADERLVDTFMRYFADCYDGADAGK